jgi:hypothetical protein
MIIKVLVLFCRMIIPRYHQYKQKYYHLIDNKSAYIVLPKLLYLMIKFSVINTLYYL